MLTEDIKDFLLRFLNQSDHVEIDRRLFFVKYTLGLLTRQKKNQGLFSLFETEKQNCINQLHNHRLLTEKLAKNNMETLMLQGCRIGLSADISALLRQIDSIDEISRIVWGKMPAAGISDLQNRDAVSILFEKEPPR